MTQKPILPHEREEGRPSFFGLLRKVHDFVTKLPAYPGFLLRWLGLQMVITLSELSFPLFVLWCHRPLTEFAEMLREDPTAMPGASDISPGLLIGGMLMGLCQVGGMIAPFFRNGLVDNLKEDFKTEQAVGVVRKMFLLPHDLHISTPTGLFPQLLRKVFQLDGIFTSLYNSLFPCLFEFACALVIFFLLFVGAVGEAGFSVACLYIPAVLVGILCVVSGLNYRSALKKTTETKAAMQGVMKEWGNLMAVVQSYEQAHFFGNVDYEVSRARSSFERIVEDIKKFYGIDWEKVGTQVLGTVCVALLGVGTVLHFAYGTGDLLARGLEMAALIKYLLFFPAVLMTFGTAVAALRSAASEYEVLYEFLNRASATADMPHAEPLRLGQNGEAPKIEFRSVTFAYPRSAAAGEAKVATGTVSEHVILDDVSFTINPGQTAGFVGASGCGKSTLLRLIMRFYAPQKGAIFVNDQDITRVTGESLRRVFSIVTQNAKLFNGTLRENVDYGSRGSGDRAIVEACKKAELNLAGLAEEADKEDETQAVLQFDEKTELRALERTCGETGAKLSGGQQQRVALARALLKNGSVFLLDEPTAALDNRVSRELMKTMAEIQDNEGSAAGKKTLLHITHRLEELKHADQIFYLSGGKIVEQGTYVELVTKGGQFAEQIAAKEKLEE